MDVRDSSRSPPRGTQRSQTREVPGPLDLELILELNSEDFQLQISDGCGYKLCALQNSTREDIFSEIRNVAECKKIKIENKPLALLNTNADSYTLSSTSFFVELGLGVTVVRKNIFEIVVTTAQDEIAFMPFSTIPFSTISYSSCYLV
jgi:hypothetical protein